MNKTADVQRFQKLAGILNEEATPQAVIPNDVKILDKNLSANPGILAKFKAINAPNELYGAFEVLFKDLGLDQKKFTKQSIRVQLDKALTNLGYK